MLTVTPGPLTNATREPWTPSVFRPPAQLQRSAPPPQTMMKTSLTPMARPWYPHTGEKNNKSNNNNNNNNGVSRESTQKEHRLVPPPALGQSPILSPTLGETLIPPVSSCSSFSPLSTPVSTCFHSFTQTASKERIYPLEMFMSVRRDAAHTPYGVLHWAVKQYLQIPSLKVPKHLQLSLHEASIPDDGVTRGALGSCLKGKIRAKPVRLTHHKVMSILSRITPAKYEALCDEMMLLPLRQVDDNELMEVCKVIFEKAVQEPSYSGIYSRLVHDICAVKDSERSTDPHDRVFSRRFRRMLITSCESEFQRPLQLSTDELVDRITGVPLDDEEVEMKRSRLKHRLVGNIRFVAELFNMGLITERIIEDIIRILVSDYDPDEPTAKEEYVFEVFVTLIRHTGNMLKDLMPNLLALSMGIAKTIELSHPKPRVAFLMMDLNDLNRSKGWITNEKIQQYVRESKRSKSIVNTSSPVTIPAPLTPATPFTSPASPVPISVNSTTNSNNITKNINTNNNINSTNFNSPNTPGSTAPSPVIPSGSVFLRRGIAVAPPLSPSSLSSWPLPDERNTNSIGKSGGLASAYRACHGKLQACTNNIYSSISSSNGNSASQVNGGYNGPSPIINFGTNNNNNDVSVTLPPSQNTIEKIQRVQHQPYGNLSLTSVNILNNGNCYDNYFNSSINSIQINSPLTPPRTTSDFIIPSTPPMIRQISDMGNSRTTSEGPYSPTINRGRTPVIDTTVNIKEITKQLMSLFRSGEEEAATKILREMGLKNMVVCLTWWLRLAATNTSFFEDRSKVASLLSSLLCSCSGAFGAKEVFSTELEWIRFDVEKGDYDNCPRMFDNVAHMILQCHLPCNDSLKHVEVVRNMMHCGLFNVLLRELSISGGTDQMVTVVKSCYPVSLQVLGNLQDSNDEGRILRIAVQNRFRLLPYLLSVSSVTNNALPGTPSSRPRLPTSPSLRSSPLGDSLTSNGHYDPLGQCLVFPRISDDPEFALFRKMRDAASDVNNNNNMGSNGIVIRWRDEAVHLALSPLGSNSTVCELIAIMRVVGAVLTGTSAYGNNGRPLATSVDLDYIIGEILRRRSSVLHQCATLMELVMYHTQALNNKSNDGTDYNNNNTNGELPRPSATDALRLSALRRVFDRWCTLGFLHRDAVLTLLHSLDDVEDNFSVYAGYHDYIADIPWDITLRELCGN